MKKTKELDSYTAYFDDLWVYQLGIEQSCYIWAIDNIKEQPKHTPLEHGFRSSLAFNCFSTEIRITENRGASWIFREELDKSTAEKCFETISKLQKKCEDANWQRDLMYTLDSPLKLSDLFKVIN